MDGKVRAGFLEEMTHGPSHKEGIGVNEAKRRSLFQTSGFLNVIGFSTHFTASHIMEKAENRDTKLPVPGHTLHPSLFLLSSYFPTLRF